MPKGKLIIFSAPSGSGKTTIVHHLLQQMPELSFSISATSRAPRQGEANGKDYYFLSPEEFKQKIENQDFIEWEEVYPDHFYGTLKSELQRIWDAGKHVVFDVDVIGGLNLKRAFPDISLAIFIGVSSPTVLEKRLRNRKTESEESLQKRLAKAKEETKFANQFDVVVLNEVLETAIDETRQKILHFLAR